VIGRPARFVLLTVVLALVPVACSEDEPEPLELGDIPSSYRITYEVEDSAGRSTEVLTVQRPFDSRIETDLTVEVTTLGRASRTSGGDQVLAVAVPPAVAPGDARVEHILGTEVLERAGRKTVADRECQVYRTGQSLRLIELLPGDDVEVCIDANGLVLEERDGDRVRTATKVEIGVDASFAVDERTIPILNGGGAVQALTDDSRTPGRFWELGDDLPLPHAGRYAVVPPQPDAFTDITLRGRRVATTTDVLTDGVDVIVIDRGGTLEGIDVIADDDTLERVDLGDLGEGTLRPTSLGVELTVELPENRFVRITGTLPVDDLLAVARGMHEVEGGELVPVGERW